MHYGSATDLTTNYSTVNSYFFTIDSRPFENIAVSFKTAINNSRMGFDPLTNWVGPIDQIGKLDFAGYAEVNTYSDLASDSVEFDLNLNFIINDNLSLLAEANYQNFDDNQPYVYGDTTGRWFYGKLSLRYIF